MLKRLLIVGTVIATGVLGSASQVGATPGIGGCGTMYQLVSVQQAVDLIDRRPYSDAELADIAVLIDEAVDANGDGMVCVTQFAPNPGQDKQWGYADYVITKIGDNKVQGR